MGLFSSIVHAVAAPVEHLIGKTATDVIFPVVPLSQVAGGLIDKAMAGAMAPAHVSQVPVQQRETQSTLPQYSPNYYAPSYGAPSYGGGGQYDAYGMQPIQQPYYGGQQSWGSLTQYSAPLTMPYQGYSAPQDRTWETLASLVPLFL
jgi:hypothetical protein